MFTLDVGMRKREKGKDKQKKEREVSVEIEYILFREECHHNLPARPSGNGSMRV
jgi:hypothetical protein